MCMMLLIGMVASALIFGGLLAHFSELRLIQVIQGAAVTTMVLNVSAMWKQEARGAKRNAAPAERPTFTQAWKDFASEGKATRRLVALGFGTIAFSMQDILLEPYGGQILHLAVGTTTALTALLALGGLSGFLIAARTLGRGTDPYRLAGIGALVGLIAFSAVIFSDPLESLALFAVGVAMIGFGAGLFAHCTLTTAMRLARPGQIGLALGIWGAVQASAAGSSTALGGLIRDFVTSLAAKGVFGEALSTPAMGYSVVYHIEIAMLFVTLVAVGPLVRSARAPMTLSRSPLNLVEFPG
jgi:BCD family chlorophyll transporter-like MFS transporter